FSGEQHHSGRSNWEVYKSAIEKDATLLKGLWSIRELAETLDQELRVPEVDWHQVGRLLTQEWAIRRDVFKVSTPRLDAILRQLEAQGVLGAKVCGAAAGGSLLVLVEPSQRASVAAAMERDGIQVLKTRPVP